MPIHLNSSAASGSTRDPDKKVVSVPMPRALIAAIKRFARPLKMPLATAVNMLCRERLGMPPAPPAKKGGPRKNKRRGTGAGKGFAVKLTKKRK